MKLGAIMKHVAIAVCAFGVCAAWTCAFAASDVSARLTWGDQGDGKYRNPVLNSDFSDPDVIRVGEKYYMVASEFHFIGMQILESDDMVNWRYVTQVYRRFDLSGWDENRHYAGGSWAPAIRHHDGWFWIYFCTPDEGLFMTKARRPEGPWTPLLCVKSIPRWEDPCPFWDDDGNAYLGHSVLGAGPIIIHRMSPDGEKLLDDGVTVYKGPIAEGTKIFKKDGWYYISIPEGGVERGYQTILRAKSIFGPFERKVVLERGSTSVNGPHQGALVDTPQGEWWFYHFQRLGALGRVVHLQPVKWENGWPQIGVDYDGNGVGEPVPEWNCPFGGTRPSLPQMDDEFDSVALAPQWQWNHNPDNGKWSLSEAPGFLVLHASKSGNFAGARNTLTQKTFGYASEATVKMDVSGLAEGGRAGLCVMGNKNVILDARDLAGANGVVWLRVSFNMHKKSYRFSFSRDGKTFSPHGEPFFVDYGHWKGVRWGVYHYNERDAAGVVKVDWAHYKVVEPTDPVKHL